MMYRRAKRRDQIAAAAFVGLLFVFSLLVLRFGDVSAPKIVPFIPLCAVLWSAADLIAAYLLFMQFSVNGIRAFAYLGGAYAFVGLVTIPYVVYLPGVVFDSAPSIASQQVSLWLWLVWHLVFPAIIGGYRIYDPPFRKRFLEAPQVRSGLRVALFAVGAGAALTYFVVVYVVAGHVPLLTAGGQFTRLWTGGFMPLVFVINGAAAIGIIGFSQRPSLLQLCVAVALATAALDGMLNAFVPGPDRLSWYVGKLETLATGLVVTLMLLAEIRVLYRRLGVMAVVDPLTGLPNRRSFDEYLQWTLGQRRKAEVAFLLLDVDCFKQFNDRYGHGAGDVCLQRVAGAMRGALLRSVDLAARYGGEEFVVLLPDTTALGALDVAERIRAGVEALAIPHDDSAAAPVVTVSVGAAHAKFTSGVDRDRLYALADRALYAAKMRRNSVVVAESILAESILDSSPAVVV